MTNENYREIKSLAWIEISDQEYKNLTGMVYKWMGINLTGQKRSLVMGRLQKILRKRNMSSFKEYLDFLKNDKKGEALSELANQISTNHTFFFREKDHFDYFYEKFLPELKQKLKNTGAKDIRIWSAGCSSGEEPYTLVMLMQQYFNSSYAAYDAGILATDISLKALDSARKGVYNDQKIASTPKYFLTKYFKKNKENEWIISEQIKKEVVFRRFNLMNKVFPFRRKFHAIFCRNVMIYFDAPTREALINRFYNSLEPGGYLFIGHSESLNRGSSLFRYVKPALYQKPLTEY